RVMIQHHRAPPAETLARAGLPGDAVLRGDLRPPAGDGVIGGHLSSERHAAQGTDGVGLLFASHALARSDLRFEPVALGLFQRLRRRHDLSSFMLARHLPFYRPRPTPTSDPTRETGTCSIGHSRSTG